MWLVAVLWCYVVGCEHCEGCSSADRASWAKREERIPTRCKNIDNLLSIPDVDYWLLSRHVSGIFMPIIRPRVTAYGFWLVVLDVTGCGAVVLRCRVWALWRLQLELQPSQCSHPTTKHHSTATSHIQHYQLKPICSNTWSFLLIMGIKMPETCRDSS